VFHVADSSVGADGVKSIVRPLVVGDAAFDTARPSGSSAFRFTISIDILEENHLTGIRMLDKSKSVGLYVHLALDSTNRSIVIYPCRDFNLLNFVAIVPDTMLENKSVESWSAEGSRDELVNCFKDFDDETVGLLR
jgi:salicylate hydroxylase